MESLSEPTRSSINDAFSRAANIYKDFHHADFPFESRIAQQMLQDIGEAEDTIIEILKSEEPAALEEIILLTLADDIIRWEEEIIRISLTDDIVRWKTEI